MRGFRARWGDQDTPTFINNYKPNENPIAAARYLFVIYQHGKPI